MDVEHDELPPLPQLSSNTSPKRPRRRPPIGPRTAFVSSAVVPHPGPDQVISTLIDSLTAISQSARDQLKLDLAADAPLNTVHSERPSDDFDFDGPPSPGSYYAESAFAASIIPASDVDDDSDGDAAAPPVIRFSRAPPVLPKRRSKKLGSSQSFNTMLSDRSISIRTSMQSMRSQDGSNAQSLNVLNKRNNSVTSLALSMMSSRSRKTSPVKTSRNPSPQPRPEPGPPASATPVQHGPSEQDSSPKRRDSTSNDRGDDSHASSTLSPLNREKLEEHLIPSRQSSIRKAERMGQHRHSTGSRDLKDLKIDEELIGSDDSTVRRIRELQEAREKRHSEWRKESALSPERSSKRHSAPSPKPLRRSSTYQSSKLSVTEVLVESEQEASPQLSARVNATDLVLMPALVATGNDDSPLTPVGDTASETQSARPATHSPATVPKLASPTPPLNRGTSMQHKRTSVTSNKADSRAEDIKTISDEVEAFLSAPRLTQKLRHPRTGRTIAFSEVGDPNGFVVFCCVGMGLTRFVTSFYDELARTLKLRIITPDRPGVGESEAVPERLNNPLTWVDDVAVICHMLEITRFSLLAHSAGTIFALATALKMPQFVRGRIHLLAPWIPPSQMPKGAVGGTDAQPVANLPMSHRILSVLPAPMLKVANSRFLSATSASVEAKPLKNKKSKHLDSLDAELFQSYDDLNGSSFVSASDLEAPPSVRGMNREAHALRVGGRPGSPSPEPRTSSTYASRPTSPRLTLEARSALYNAQLTHRIWSLATLNANPAVDLMTCLERKKYIGFRYADVTRSIVIRHGAKDTRVPLENVKYLESIMKRCELRVLQDEGHSLMASASVMSSVLSEISKEWDEWEKIARDKQKRKADSSAVSTRSGRR
ncbi:uncharacterized protein HMPREF1541_08767 [Cyphellophora europaea CBS 101466]|uniref:AB hydrolase-1 domain-containing protein n=1 Tax=Cyphellophora europaea (strain CBS 101466) TaxID=1220924 RepID=W2RL87_CYPE1|nr:uncharacterized protein HMPREF1541_08767 [Cyphellophora europaea CBS 101466]ETN36489.1 hypothetical protein HMPREF1541_08767 [Cyphellophora europaea CBS 101466]